VSLAQAIRKLREKLNHDQGELATKLGVTVTTISRYENGREPSAKVLNKLAVMAREAKEQYLAEVFAVRRQADILSRNGNLPSPGTSPRVARTDLERWEEQKQWGLDALRWLLEQTKEKLESEPKWQLASEFLGVEVFEQQDLRLYLAHPETKAARVGHSFVRAPQPARAERRTKFARGRRS
jgi:transcriptional regulator with XRE-family HTH domain